MKKAILLILFFIPLFGGAQAPIHNFTFDGTYNDSVGTSYFFQSSNFFRPDRNEDPLKAIEVNSVSAGIAGGAMSDIPLGTSPRTISIWVKFLPSANSLERYMIFGYGGNGENLGFNLTQAFDSTNPNGVHVLQVSTAGFSSVNSVNTNVAVQQNVWYHYVVSFDGSVVKVYRNNSLLINQTVSGWNTTVGSGALRLGNNTVGQSTTAPIYLDDLQVFNAVLDTNAISGLYSFNTTSPIITPTVSNISALSSANSVTITGNVNANNGATTTVVKYGLTNSNLSNQVSGPSVTGSADTPVSASITGLLANTQYFYKVEATNSAGTTSSPIGTFTTGVPIAEYTFDNTYNNVNGNTPFGYGINTSFVNDRNGIPSGVLSIGALVTSPNVNITSLPQGTFERSISIWYKVASNTGYPSVFSYGTAAIKQTFGLYLGPNGNPIFQGFGAGNDIDFGGTYAANTWHHVVIILQSNGNLQLYMNGNLLNTVGLSLNTIGTNFKLISNGVITQVDDLKIYNYALSAAAVSSLHTTNSTLSNSDFSQNNLEVALYPNPVNDVLNIETALEIQSVEIYNIQGQKVLATNQKEINVSALTSGIYLVRIQDADNNIATKKIVIQ